MKARFGLTAKVLRISLVAIGFLLLSAGCASSLKKSLDGLEPGLDKSQVIDQVGSPNRSFRRDNQDVWLYRVHEEDQSYLHELTFEEGRLVYSGPERDQRSRTGLGTMKTPEEAQEILRRKLKPHQRPPNFKEVQEDGTVR